MQEAKDPKRASNETAEGGTATAGGAPESRDADATSSETLREIEEKVSDTSDADRPSTSTPSPDGAFDEQRGGGDDAGPM